MQGHFKHQFLIEIFYAVANMLFFMANKITANFKDSDKLLKNFDQYKQKVEKAAM